MTKGGELFKNAKRLSEAGLHISVAASGVRTPAPPSPDSPQRFTFVRKRPKKLFKNRFRYSFYIKCLVLLFVVGQWIVKPFYPGLSFFVYA